MEESLPNMSLLAINISSPDSDKPRTRNNNVDNNLLKRKKPIEKNKGTPKKRNVKRNTISGDDYQRILQILIRHRSLQTPGVKIGSEVSDISDLDDIVYLRGRTCKFFQIKHSMLPITKAQLFKIDFPHYESLQSPLNKKIKRHLHLALYFEAFVHIREISRFKNFEVEDLYFVTNSRFKDHNNEMFNNLLLQDTSLENDQLLFLDGTSAEKYNLNVKLVKELFYKYLKSQYQYIMKIENMTLIQLERFEELIKEFLTKIRIVMNYPDIKTVRSVTMKEIFGELDLDTRDIYENFLINKESELLKKTDEYLTSEEWKSNIDRVNSSIDKLKMIGITEYQKNIFSWNVGDLNFKNESINNMYEDLTIFLESPNYFVLHLCQIENMDLTVATVLKLLERKNIDSDYYIFCKLEGLVSTDGLINSFLQGDFKLLIIACSDENTDYDLTEMVSIVEKSFNESGKKYIFISQNEDIFKSYPNIFNNTKYHRKHYINGFKALDDVSKLKILNKIITFQGKYMSLGSVFQNSRKFAEKVINDSCILEIVNPKSLCTVSNTEAFSSLGYDKNYYIPRTFLQYIKMSEQVTDVIKLNENSMMDLLTLEKTIIVVGNSGEGKSTVLTHIANLLKDRHENIWFIRVNLRIFFSKNKVTTLGDVTTIECALEMAFKMAFPNEPNKLEELLFKEGLRENKLKVVILLDGFNELRSHTQNKVCAFVKTVKLIDSILQCWITTQKQNKRKLEKYLKVRAYALKPLSDKDQIDLLVKYWAVEYSKKNPPEYYNNSVLKADAYLALNRWKQCIFDENERAFTSVSLNLKMLADILLDRKRKLDQHLSLLDLYNLFVKQKFLCYSRETSVNCNSCVKDEDLDSAKENLFVHSVRKVLQYISADTVISQLPDTNAKKNKFPGMQAYDKFRDRVGGGNEEYSNISLSKIGLLTLKNDKFELSHESYVQFFFSEYIMNYFSDSTVQWFLMEHVLVAKSFQLCRRFIDKLFSYHMQNKTGEFHINDIDRIPLTGTAQLSFKKDTQLKVVIENRLLNILHFVSNKLSVVNRKACLNKVVKYILKSFRHRLSIFAKEQDISNDLESIEDNLNALSIPEIIKLLEEPNLFSETVKSYDEARTRVQTILKISNKTKRSSSVGNAERRQNQTALLKQNI